MRSPFPLSPAALRVAAALFCFGVAGGLVAPGLSARAPGPVQREEIVSYDVTIDVRDGNRMVVTEVITVQSAGQRIQRGIYRDFPTSFPRFIGLGRIVAPFEVLEVTRDGRAEPYSLERFGGSWGRGGVRVRIGDADVFLDDGLHRYSLTYETARWITHTEAGDELYWNVTGNGWEFPIGRASAEVMLPRSASDADVVLEVWTGPEGSTDSNAVSSWDSATGRATFATNGPLLSREGLTFRLTTPPGTIAPASADDRRDWFFADWGTYVEGGVVFGLVTLLYLAMWLRVGRDPARGHIVTRYEPPEGFSPAALGYLENRGYEDSQRAAALVSLAVKGALKIEQKKSKWTLRRTGDTVPDLPPEEQALLDGLLGSRKSISLSSSHASDFKAATKKLRRRMQARLETTHFLLNRRWFLAGLGVSVLGLIVLAWRDAYGINPAAWFLMFWLSFWTIGAGSLVIRALQAWGAAFSGTGVGAWAAALAVSAFAAPFVIAELVVIGFLLVLVPQGLAFAALLLGLVNVLFFHLLERPTLKGRGVLNQLDGFKAFLTAADEDRLDRLTPPDRTPELFERYLPHAIALGLENRWADTFEAILGPAAIATAATSGALAWYSRSGGSGDGFSGLASSLGAGFSNSLSSASSPPSSGGSGGGSSSGGSSGGGGGGGGGGGW